MSGTKSTTGVDRATFLATVRAALGRGIVESTIPEPPALPEALRLVTAAEDLVELFITRATEVGLIVHRTTAADAVSTVVALVERLDLTTVALSLGESLFQSPDGEASQSPDGEASQSPDGEASQSPDGDGAESPDGDGAQSPDGEGVESSDGEGAVAARLRDDLDRGPTTIVDWRASPGLDALYDVDAGITDVAQAVAETGTIIMRSDAPRSRGVFLVPPVHIAILYTKQIVPDLVDLWPDADQPPDLPAATVLVSGPSKTADIEGILVTGVHGPREVHVVLVDDRGDTG